VLGMQTSNPVHRKAKKYEADLLDSLSMYDMFLPFSYLQTIQGT